MSEGIIAYSDFRLFLRDTIESKKRVSHFSVAKLAEKIGIGHSQFKMVLIGKRNINEEQILRIAAKLNFSFEEATYFEALVRENQASTKETKRFYSRRRKLAKDAVKVTGRIAGKELSLDAWHVPALLLYLIDIEGAAHKLVEEIDRERIKKLFRLSENQLDKSLSNFQKAKFLDIQRDGKVHVRLDNFGARLPRQEFILNVLGEARRRIQTDFAQSESFFSADTVSISQGELGSFIEDYKKLIATYIGKDLIESEPTKIVQIGFQLFPVN